MRIRHLVHEIRGALRLHKLECYLSDADIEAILRDSAEEVSDSRRTRDIVECAIAKVDFVCRELSAGVDPSRVELPSCRKATNRAKR